MDEAKKIQWMERALRLAQEAALRDEVPVGAVLVCGDELIAEGSNRREELHSSLAHAELQALEEYQRTSDSWRVPRETTLFVTVEPCLMCTGALLWARVDHIVFGCTDTKNAGLNRLRDWIEDGIYDHRFQSIEGGLLEERCAKLISDFFAAKRSVSKNADTPSLEPESPQSQAQDQSLRSPSPRIL